LYLFKLKKGIAFLYEVDKTIYKQIRYYLLKDTLINNDKVTTSTLRSGNESLESGYFTRGCEYQTLDKIIEDTLKFKKQYMMMSAVFHNDGTY